MPGDRRDSIACEIPAVADFRYRPDVDGLRAVAVVLVLLFHAGFGFSGGYVGVDVFFVISGYLITGLILKEQSAGKFSLSRFWVRRIRRIIPAASAMALATLIVGGFLLLPADFDDLGQATIAQQLMASNIFFWRTTGYFSGPAELKPLLHTWSLAVEEQFYIGYPFLLLFVRRFRPRVVLILLAGLTLASLIASELSVQTYPAATFYLLPTRAWEMLVGGLLWFLPVASRLKPWQNQLLGSCGLLGVIVCGCVFDAGTTFPGAMALAPCLAGAALIYSGSAASTWASRILSSKPVVAVGLASYSLYLWHWPILAYLRYWRSDLSTGWRVAALVATSGAAYLSYRFIETPFRHSTRLLTLWTAGRFATLSAGSMVAVCVAICALDGLVDRFSPDFQTALEQAAWTGGEFLEAQPVDPDTHLRQLGAPPETSRVPRIIVWGDSHAQMCVEAIHLAGCAVGESVLVAAQPGLPPVPGLHGVWNSDGGSAEDLIQDERVLRISLQPQFTDVVLVCRWSLYVEGCTPYEHSLEAQGQQGSSSIYMSGPPEQLAAEFEHRSLAMARQLLEAGKRVWIVRQIPELRQRLADDIIRSRRFGSPLQLEAVDRQTYLARQQRITPVLDELERLGARIIDPGECLFAADGRVVPVRDGQALYRDDDHLSRLGAKVVIQPTLEQVFRIIQTGSHIAKSGW